MEHKVISALLIGMAIGAASVPLLTPAKTAVAAVQPAAGWTAEHAAIPYDLEPREPAPTF